MLTLNSPLEELKGVGEKTAGDLEKLGIKTISDLLFHIPFRHEEFSQAEEISSLKIGENVKIKGEVELISGRRGFRRKMHVTEALISDGKNSLKAVWFNQPFLSKTIKIGDRLFLSGKVSEGYGGPCLVSPDYKKINEELITGQNNSSTNEKDLEAVYRLSGALTQKVLRRLTAEALKIVDKIPEWLPSESRKKLSLISLSEALLKIHQAKNQKDILAAQKRLAFSELFLRQLKSQKIKLELAKRKAPLIKFQEQATKDFINSLPFKLTNAQKKAAWEILRDLEKPRPMSRLLEGDVGSGKTLVAALALLNTALNGEKAALMVPSEILAKQHYQTLSKLFKNQKFSLALKTRSFKEGDFETADIIIGTQALIQEKAMGKKLALTIVDEQHRFGVRQRKKIIDGSSHELSPHFLSLSATPIPRSLSLAIYGDLDLSIIDELPKGRKETITKIVKEKDRAQAHEFIKDRLKTGRQAFFVYPLIDESDKLSLKSVKQDYDLIAEKYFKEFKCALIHGKTKKQEKEKTMADFSQGKIDILLATSVIEVGIDIPNATIIIIENAERFGLSQLHQLRGRVNRSDKQSFCFLFLSKENISDKSLERLKALEEYKDGLSLAKIDLKMRGAGEIFGSLQSGFSEIALSALFDYGMIKTAQEEAERLIKTDPELNNYPLLKNKLGNFENDLHLE